VTAREASARTVKAIRATAHQEMDEINFFHTNAQMVDARVRGDDVGDISFSIGLAVFFLEGIGTKAQKLAAIRGIASAIVVAADFLEAELDLDAVIVPEQLDLGQ
jgi:hypothetical protein